MEGIFRDQEIDPVSGSCLGSIGILKFVTLQFWTYAYMSILERAFWTCTVRCKLCRSHKKLKILVLSCLILFVEIS